MDLIRWGFFFRDLAATVEGALSLVRQHVDNGLPLHTMPPKQMKWPELKGKAFVFRRGEDETESLRWLDGERGHWERVPSPGRNLKWYGLYRTQGTHHDSIRDKTRSR